MKVRVRVRDLIYLPERRRSNQKKEGLMEKTLVENPAPLSVLVTRGGDP